MSVYNSFQEASRLKSLGVDVVSVGVGDKVNLAELTQMATNPALTLRTRNFDQFFGLLPRLQNVVCERKYYLKSEDIFFTFLLLTLKIYK
jgi:hypothetical protein